MSAETTKGEKNSPPAKAVEGQQSKPPAKADAGDRELKLLGRVVKAIGSLEPESRERVGRYLADRFGPKPAGGC